ncbi:NAD/NADP octopine/nopaline dehydrogenase family protein [Breoghania sp. JC706]|uniref:NAD/NADP octopine/nopaline dehydrogenase family protein n=1 Tax=Breoghania sp. JC706 TaxID=3117732 RepID=UPI00300815F9
MARVAIIGGGNLGHAFAAVMSGENAVSVFTRRSFPRGDIVARTRTHAVVGRPVRVCSEPEAALRDADVVFVTVPGSLHEEALRIVAAHAPKNCLVGALPAAGLFADLATKLLDDPERVFLGREAPYNCRISRRGDVVEIYGVAPRLGVAVLSPGAQDAICGRVSVLLGLPVDPLSSVFVPLLRPVNTLLHPATLVRLLEVQKETGGFAEPPLLYAHWTHVTAQLYLDASSEVRALAQALGVRDLSEIQLVPQHYQTNDADRLAERIRSIEGLRRYIAPCCLHGDRYFLDTASRLFTEDVDISLAHVLELTRLHGTPSATLVSLASCLSPAVRRKAANFASGLAV